MSSDVEILDKSQFINISCGFVVSYVRFGISNRYKWSGLSFKYIWEMFRLGMKLKIEKTENPCRIRLSVSKLTYINFHNTKYSSIHITVLRAVIGCGKQLS